MRRGDRERAKVLEAKLRAYAKKRPLPGSEEPSHRWALVEQIVESIRRVEFVGVLRTQKLSASRADPSSENFDPVRAAILRATQGEREEAYWLIFLFVHFGKHVKTGWQLARDFYGALGGKPWTWSAVTADAEKFVRWFKANEVKLASRGGKFGNHRKYESLKANSARGFPAVVKSYIEWVKPPRTHDQLVVEALSAAGGDPKRAFGILYESMGTVLSFGRMGRFDYLTMIAKVGLANIEPGIPFLQGATGPLRGARLLFGGSVEAEYSAAELDQEVRALGAQLGVGMQVMEDSICNWQKSPGKFVAFRG